MFTTNHTSHHTRSQTSNGAKGKLNNSGASYHLSRDGPEGQRGHEDHLTNKPPKRAPEAIRGNRVTNSSSEGGLPNTGFQIGKQKTFYLDISENSLVLS